MADVPAQGPSLVVHDLGQCYTQRLEGLQYRTGHLEVRHPDDCTAK